MRRLLHNPTSESYATGSEARHANDSFNYTYTSLLKTLHATFQRTAGAADGGGRADGVLQAAALDMGTLPVGDGTFAGPSFRYRPTNP